MSDTAAPPRATIAIPVFNSADTLPRCLRSAMHQTLSDIEILVVDDGSADGSADVVKGFAAEDSRIRLLQAVQNGGKPRAMNRMTEEARGVWFAVLDADDAYLPQRLACLIKAAETAGVEMAADNQYYIDAGAGRVMQTAFPPGTTTRMVSKHDLAKNSDCFGNFDFGILKPVMRREFLIAHNLRYYEDARLSEDFYYLMDFFVAGGRGCLLSEPMYEWTLPFGPLSRQWTGTGQGAWRYDYRSALKTNRYFLDRMRASGELQMAAVLEHRERQYISMVHYIDAQRAAADGRLLAAAAGIATHPSTYSLLLRRVGGRLTRDFHRRVTAGARLLVAAGAEQ